MLKETPNPEWAEERSQMRTVANSLILHLHPTKVPVSSLRFVYTWGLGGMSVILGILIAMTGILLMFRYDASLERAYVSIQLLESEVPFGSLFRAIHHWASNLLVITLFLHMVRVFLTAAFKRNRALNWMIGLSLFILVLAFNFTGYLLPWDQLSYWAATVATSLFQYIPLVGTAVSNFLLGGTEVGQATLRNFYALHVAVLPVIFIAVVTYHFWRIRKDGGISRPIHDNSSTKTTLKTVTTIPHLVQKEAAAASLLIAGVLLWSMWLPAPLVGMANPTLSPNPAKAAWYFLGLQELLLHMHPTAAIGLVVIILLGFLLLPLWDRSPEGFGLYFRSPKGRISALTGFLLAVNIIPMLIIVDEYWFDLPAMLPSWPLLLSNGLLPLLLSLVGLGVIYLLIRKGLKASHSEATLGLGVFILVSFIVMTLVGIYLRGPNMALVFA